MGGVNSADQKNEGGVVISETLDINTSIMREIGEDAVWSISTAKAGNGIEQIRDNNTDTYWQSGDKVIYMPFNLSIVLQCAYDMM